MQVWAHWNHCIHMHLSFLGPVYCAFSPWVSYQGWQQKLTARWGTSCLHPKFFQGHCQGGCKVVASWLQHPLFAGMVGSIFHSQKGGLKACPSQALLLQQVCPALAVSLWPLDMPGLAYRKQLLFSEHLFWRWRDSQRLAFFKQHLEEMTNSSENLTIQRHKFFLKQYSASKWRMEIITEPCGPPDFQGYHTEFYFAQLAGWSLETFPSKWVQCSCFLIFHGWAKAEHWCRKQWSQSWKT